MALHHDLDLDDLAVWLSDAGYAESTQTAILRVAGRWKRSRLGGLDWLTPRSPGDR